jgi:aspartate racemase
MSPLLLSTRFTIEERVYADYLADRFGIVVRVPILAEQEFVHRTIYAELCNGVVNATSRSRFVELIERSARRGSDGVILGCTEIGLLIKQSDVTPPLFDSAAIHAAAAVRFALSR